MRRTHAVSGELIAKAVRDIMRLSSGLKYLLYVLVCTCIELCGTSQYIHKLNILPQVVRTRLLRCQHITSPGIQDVHVSRTVTY